MPEIENLDKFYEAQRRFTTNFPEVVAEVLTEINGYAEKITAYARKIEPACACVKSDLFRQLSEAEAEAGIKVISLLAGIKIHHDLSPDVEISIIAHLFGQLDLIRADKTLDADEIKV